MSLNEKRKVGILFCFLMEHLLLQKSFALVAALVLTVTASAAFSVRSSAAF